MKTVSHKKGRPEGAKTRFPGIGEDARALGVNLRTLQRVLTGEWKSKSLSERYAALKAGTLKPTENKGQNVKSSPRFSTDETKPAPASSGIDPSSAFLGWEYIDKVLTPLKWTPFSVAFQGRDIDYILHKAGPSFDQQLGEELGQAGLAEWDSTRKGDPFIIFYYAGKGCLPAALLALKDKLAHLEILRVSKIAYADPGAKIWHDYYPEPQGKSTI